jgi:hypothetical protein
LRNNTASAATLEYGSRFEVRIMSTVWIGVLVPIILLALARSASRGASSPGVIDYSKTLKRAFLALAFGPSLLFAALFAFRPPPDAADDWPHLLAIILLFPAIAWPLLLEALRVRHTFDEEGIHVQSPWSRRRFIRWSDVASIRWRNVMKWLDLRTSGGERLHVSPLMNGLDGFARAARAHLPAPVLDAASSDARAVLALMEQRLAFQLVMAQVPPATLIATAVHEK